MKTEPEFPHPSPEELEGLLAGYQVTELISSDSSGALYRAVQTSLEREVTIKVLPPSMIEADFRREAFEADAKSMANLSHPHLVNVYDYGDIEGMLYVIMERVPGRTLQQTTAGHAVDEIEGGRLITELCHGLEHAHKAGIIHQTLNPQNVLINKNAEAKILDFGMAGLTGLNAKEQAAAYCAPEVFEQGENTDVRADIYSLGMIFYELLVGRLPGDPYVPPSEASDCIPVFDVIVAQAIQKDPFKRYSSAEKMARDIQYRLNELKSKSLQETTHNMVTPSNPAASLPAASMAPAKASHKLAVVVTLLIISMIAAGAYFMIKPILDKAEAEATAPESADKADYLFKNKPESKPEIIPEDEKPESNEETPELVITSEEAQAEKGDVTEVAEDLAEEVAEEAKGTPDLPIEEAIPPLKPISPDFELDAYLAQARRAVQDKGKKTINDYDKDLANNINRFERKVKRAIRKADRQFRKAKELASDDAFAMYRENGRLPEVTNADAPWEIRQIYPEALNDQQKIDDQFKVEFIKLQSLYAKDLQEQITQLKEEGNDYYADELKDEILDSLADMDYFVGILRSPEPNE